MKTMRCNLAILFSFALALLAGAPMCASAQGPYIGAQATINPNYGWPAQTFTATAQTGAIIPLAGFSEATIAVTSPGYTAAVTNPTPTASTSGAGSVATFTLTASGDKIQGTLNVAITTGTPCIVTIPTGTTLAAAVTLLNANTCVATTNSIVASTSTDTLILTGPVGATGSANLVVSPSALTFTSTTWTATYALQGTNDGTNFFPLLLASIVVPGTTATTETATTNTMYIANVSGLTQIRVVTSSTFTAGNTLTVHVVASSNHGLL